MSAFPDRALRPAEANSGGYSRRQRRGPRRRDDVLFPVLGNHRRQLVIGMERFCQHPSGDVPLDRFRRGVAEVLRTGISQPLLDAYRSGLIRFGLGVAVLGLTTAWMRLTEQWGRPQVITREDLRTLAELGEAHGVLRQEQRRMIHAVLELERQRVAHVMRPFGGGGLRARTNLRRNVSREGSSDRLFADSPFDGNIPVR